MVETKAMSTAPQSVDDNAGKVTFAARQLVKTYDTEAGEVHALRGIDLELLEGEFVVLLGPSGSGKSTFLNILGGLDAPTSGHVLFRDDDLADFSEQISNRLSSRPHRFRVPVLQSDPEPDRQRECRRWSTDIAREPLVAGTSAAVWWGCHDRMDHFPAQLSGGEQQRVAVARAIAKRPDVLLCDEPTGALDSKTGIVVLEALERASRAIRTTTVLITHNAAIGDMADRVIHFADGRIVQVRVNAARRPPAELSW